MKMKYVVTLLSLFVVFGTACKKKSNGAPPVVTPPAMKTDSLSAVINSVSWITYSATSNLIPSTADSGAYNLQISGTTQLGSATSTMTIYVTNYKGPASFGLTPPAVSITYYVGSARHYATSGNLNITADSTSFIGNFYFTADSINAVSGVFAIPR